MLHEPIRAAGRQSTLLHAVQHGGVSCKGGGDEELKGLLEAFFAPRALLTP